MDVAAKSKARPVCGFCRRGEEAESTCGPLFTSEICNAHKKCMQYSALLVQYRAKTFGGFKKHKVLEEIKRGRSLSCSLCKGKKRGKQKNPSTGASCGCAISTCRKTFHYYCANEDPSTRCRRIEVRHKVTGKKNVQYRIFCSEEHHKKYESSEKDFEFTYNDASSESDSGSEEEEEEDESSPVQKGKRKSTNNYSKNKNISKSSSKRRAQSEVSSNSEDETKDESNDEGKSEYAEADSGTQVELSKRLGSAPKKPKTDSPALHPTEEKVLAVADSSIRLGEITFKEERMSPDGSQVKKSPSNSTSLAEVYLCIMEAPHLKDKLGDRIRGIIANQYNTPESSVAFWSGRGQNMISAEHMIYFLKDVAQYVYDSDTKSLARIITDPTTSDVEKYNHNVRFNEDYMDVELVEHVQTKIRDVIGNFFCQKRDTSGEDCGSAYFLGELNTMFIALPLSKGIDPTHAIRDHVCEPCHIFSIELNTQLLDPKRMKISQEGRTANSNKEVEALFRWLKINAEETVKIKIRPKEIILRQNSMSSTTCNVCTQLQKHCKQTSDPPSSTVMFVVPVNAQIMAYRPYCEAVISAFVEEDLTALSPVYCVLDVDNLEGITSVSDIIPSLPENVSVEAFCGLDPKLSPISCLILKLYIKS